MNSAEGASSIVDVQSNIELFYGAVDSIQVNADSLVVIDEAVFSEMLDTRVLVSIPITSELHFLIRVESDNCPIWVSVSVAFPAEGDYQSILFLLWYRHIVALFQDDGLVHAELYHLRLIFVVFCVGPIRK